MKAYMPMNLKTKNEIESYRKKTIKGRKISMTYKKLGGKILSVVQIH